MAEADGYENGLFDIIEEYFDLEELKDFCFKLKVDYDNLEGGENKRAKTRQLIMFAKRHRKILELEEMLVSERPELASKIRILTRKNLLALINLYGIQTSNRFTLVLDFFKHNIHQGLKMREQRSTTEEKDIKFFASVKDYWLAYEAEELKKGMWIEIEGTFSECGPLLFGAPWAKKEDHFNWRSYVSDVEAALGIDGIVSISSGNAIIRPNKVPVQSPSNGQISYNKYAGLYQYIGRNSIPIIIDEQLLLRALEEAKEDSEIKLNDKTHACKVRIRGSIEEPSGFNSTITTVPERFDKKQYVLQVAGDGAFMKIIGSLDFFESDIWAVVESKGIENMVVRCPDLSEKEAIEKAVYEISIQLKQSFGSNYSLEAQFDEYGKPFGPEQREEQYIDMSESYSKFINLVRQLYQLGK